MTFDIHQPIFDPVYGEYDEEAGSAYQETLEALFAESPEGQALAEQGIEQNWTWAFLDYAISYCGVTPPKMTLAHVDEVLFELFPRKVSTEPESAASIIAELRAFWTFLGRAFSLPNARTILKRFDEAAIQRLQRLLADPSMFGMAKSLVMMGKARGFDTTTEAGLNAWMHTYNSELPLPGPGISRLAPPQLPRSTPPSTRKAAEKKRRQMAKASQRQNRRS